MWPSQIEAFEAAKGPIPGAVSRTQRQYDMAEAQAGPELAAQEPHMLGEVLHHILRSFAAERHHIHRGELQIRRHPHLGYGEGIFIQHVVDDLAAGEDLGQRMPD